MSGRIWSAHRALALGLLLLTLPAASGCAQLFGGLNTAPSGLGTADERLRSLLIDGEYEQALEMLGAEEAGWVGDPLLRLQYEGLVAHYAGRWERSSRALERAFGMAEDRYTKSVNRALLSLVTNDRILSYDPPQPERLLFHYYGALNYLRRDEPDEAAVEARRLGHLLQRSLEDEDSSPPPTLGQALGHFTGAVFEAADRENEAAVAYRQSRAFGDRAESGEAGAPHAGPGPSASPHSVGLAPLPSTADPPTTGSGGEILVILERGFVAHKVQRDLTLFLLPGEIHRLRDFHHAARTDTVTADTADVLDLARQVSDRHLGTGGGPGVRRANMLGDGDFVVARVAWPDLREAAGSSEPALLRVAGEDAAIGPAARTSLSEAVRQEFERSRAMKMAKSLVRAAAKLSIAEGLEDAVPEESETLGEVLGATARIAGTLLERADTRSWHLLPGRLELFRLRLEPGTHRIEARIPTGRGTEARRLDLGEVEVSTGTVQVLTARAWR